MKLLKTARPRTLAAAAVSAAFLVPLGVFGAPALAKSAASASQYEYSGSSQYQYKVTICHHTHSKKHPMHTIKVSSSAVKAHMKHGDTVGACAPTTASAKKHGHSQGKKDDDHNSSTSSSSSSTSGSEHGKSGDDHGKSGDDHGNGGGNNGRGHGK